MKKPKVLVLDIETCHIIASIWDKGEQYISHKQVVKDWAIVAWSAKWLGDPVSETFYGDQRKAADIRNDKTLLMPLRGLLDDADFIMTQNGKNFDWPKIQARFMLNKIKFPSYFEHIDLYKEFKNVGFTSHSLDYMTDKFCVKYKKLDHSEFPGDSLWKECEKGNLRAWACMKKYNNWDVWSLEELFENTKEYLPKVTYKISCPVRNCKNCGGKRFLSNGTRSTKKEVYKRKNCAACGTPAKEVLE